MSTISSQNPSANSHVADSSSHPSSKRQAWTELNCDKTKQILINTASDEWVETFASGVKRKMIERYGGEVARCTTIVEFLPNKTFPQHTHSGGEEFFVLDGVWHDDFGSFPKFSYVRNYIGSSHTPRIGESGCVIMVKLRQMDVDTKEEPHTAICVDEKMSNNWKALSGENKECVLFENANEVVSVMVLKEQAEITIPENGMEIFVVEGEMRSSGTNGHLFENGSEDVHKKWSWCRFVKSGEKIILDPHVTNDDKSSSTPYCYCYVKSNHLNSPEVGVDESLKV